MSRLPEFQYLIRADGLVIDIKQKLAAEIMRPKILYMQNLLRRLSKGDSVARPYVLPRVRRLTLEVDLQVSSTPGSGIR